MDSVTEFNLKTIDWAWFHYNNFPLSTFSYSNCLEGEIQVFDQKPHKTSLTGLNLANRRKGGRHKDLQG